MKITLLQTNIVWNNPEQNCLNATKLIEQNSDTDIFILPETFSTGFATNPEGIAESNNYSLQWMQKMARANNVAICGSVAIKDHDNTFRNRLYFVNPDGEVLFYDKHHLFSLGGEGIHFTNGNERVIVNYKNVRILLQICYDIRFPIFSRNRNDYDMIIYVANWPTTRLQAWQTLLHARAIENQCYVAGVNRCGTDENCEYSGGTMLIDAYGRTIAECPYNTECSISGNIDMNILNAFRQKFPVLNDADI